MGHDCLSRRRQAIEWDGQSDRRDRREDHQAHRPDMDMVKKPKDTHGLLAP
jgi:hypothetical protein